MANFHKKWNIRKVTTWTIFDRSSKFLKFWACLILLIKMSTNMTYLSLQIKKLIFLLNYWPWFHTKVDKNLYHSSLTCLQFLISVDLFQDRERITFSIVILSLSDFILSLSRKVILSLSRIVISYGIRKPTLSVPETKSRLIGKNREANGSKL